MSCWTHPMFPMFLCIWALALGSRQPAAAAASPSSAAANPPRSRIQLPPASPADTTFHVSPSGRDTGTGSGEQPFSTLERARDAIRSLNETGATRHVPAVIIHGGEYRVTQTCVFDERDSGVESAPIVYR